MSINSYYKFFLFVAIVVSSLLLNSCKEEENPATPPPEVEHPPATMVTLIVMDNSGTSFIDSCTVRDTTVSHVKVHLFGNLDLHAGTTYQCMFKAYDDSSPDTTEFLNPDLISEKNAHVFKFAYNAADTSRIHVTNLDLDDNSLPFGLNFKIVVSAGAGATGNLHVVLEHHDDGNKSGTEFDLDLDRDFPITIIP